MPTAADVTGVAAWEARYERVYRHLLEQVSSGMLQPGDRLPGERRLAESLGMSRETVRRGLALAEETGLVTRRPARGTFVAEPAIRQDLGRMRSFDATVAGANLSPAYDVVATGSAPAERDEAKALGVPHGSPLLHVRVVGKGDQRPLAHYHSRIPQGVVDRLPDSPEWSRSASYQVIARALGLDRLSVSQRWEAMHPPADIAALLKVTEATPAFRSTSVFGDGTGNPVELRVAWYPGTRYEFSISRTIEVGPRAASDTDGGTPTGDLP